VSTRALNLMENILSTFYKYTLLARNEIVSGKILITVFFLLLICGTRAQKLSAHFSYTLYNLDIEFIVK
jgi:hypothetical protein